MSKLLLSKYLWRSGRCTHKDHGPSRTLVPLTFHNQEVDSVIPLAKRVFQLLAPLLKRLDFLALAFTGRLGGATVSQYTLNAPSDPQSYPCSTCLPVLQDVPADFSTSDPADGEQIQNAIQFCGLRSIFETSSTEGQQGLSNAGWVKDVRFCAWQGVHCDGFGRVSTL